jgi:hypothetical protein
MCVGIRIPLNLDKLHCIIIAMTCIHASHDHADSFAVVVSVASVVCCRQRQVLRVFLDNLARQALPPLVNL